MKKYKLWLGIILILALFLRLYKLNQLELFGDELDVGYHAYSLLLTGRDYRGQKWPVYIHSFSEWRAPLLMYAAAPFVGVFGLNEWGVRLPAVFFGILDIIFLALFVWELSRKEELALVSAFLLAVAPWHIHYSRAAFEVTLLLFLLLAGGWALLRGWRQHQKKMFWLAGLAFALTFYTYSTANLFTPSFLLGVAIIYFPKIKRQFSFWMKWGLVMAILVTPLFWMVIRGPAAGRFELISIFHDPQARAQIIFKRNTGVASPLVERFFHNKATAWGKSLLANYLTAFFTQFLFLTGDPRPRHNLPQSGEFFWPLIFFLAAGFWQLKKCFSKKERRLLLLWLLLAPLPAALTVGGGNHATRLFLLLPPLAIVMASGLMLVWQKRLGALVAVAAILILLLFWEHNYLVHYPREQYRYWHYGYREAMTWLNDHQGNYSQIIINNSHEPALIRYLFWIKRDPAWFQKHFHSDQEKKGILPNWQGFRLGKVFFGRISKRDKVAWLQKHLLPKTAYLAFQKDEIPGDWNWQKAPPRGLRVLKLIHDPWGKPLMEWITKQGPGNQGIRERN